MRRQPYHGCAGAGDPDTRREGVRDAGRVWALSEAGMQGTEPIWWVRCGSLDALVVGRPGLGGGLTSCGLVLVFVVVLVGD